MTGFELADGTSLQVIRRGDPAAAVTVVFVHGYALDQRSWGRIAPLVPDAAEGPVAVLTYDQRGHGGSGRARRGTATMAQLGDDLAELLAREVPDGRVVLVGHDMGGLAIMSLSQRHPSLFASRVSGLVLLATSSEEAGLRGAKRYASAHAGELAATPSFGLFVDGVYDERFLTVVYRELFTGVHHDARLVQLAKDVAAGHGWRCTTRLQR